MDTIPHIARGGGRCGNEYAWVDIEIFFLHSLVSLPNTELIMIIENGGHNENT